MCECECNCHIESTPAWVLHFYDVLPRITEVLEDENMEVLDVAYQYDSKEVHIRVVENK